MCLGEFGGHKVLYGSQENDDSCSNQGADTKDVVEKDHAHNDLEKVMGDELCARAALPAGTGTIPTITLEYGMPQYSSFQTPWGWSRMQDQVWEDNILGTHSRGSELVTRGIYPKAS